MNEPEIYDPGNEAHVRGRKKDLRIARLQEIEDIRALLATPAGKRVFRRLLSWAGVFRQCFNPNALQMAFAEGQRNFGLFLVTELMEADPNSWQLMQADPTKQPKEHESE